MKRRLPLPILLAAAAAAPALSCPPPYFPPGYVPPGPDEILRRRAEGAANIVYAVVERSLPPWRESLTGEEMGMLRILHSYKGALRAGQLIPMYGEVSQNDCMYEYDHEAAGRGHYGLIFLDAWNGRDPLPFQRFERPEVAQDLIRLGLIRSARTGSGAH